MITLELHTGEFLLWEYGPAFAALVFSESLITWCYCGPPVIDRQTGEVIVSVSWLSYIPALGVQDFLIENVHVLWVVPPEGGLIAEVLAP